MVGLALGSAILLLGLGLGRRIVPVQLPPWAGKVLGVSAACALYAAALGALPPWGRAIALVLPLAAGALVFAVWRRGASAKDREAQRKALHAARRTARRRAPPPPPARANVAAP